MATILVVDGYNAINAIPEIKKELKRSLRRARISILVKAKEYARSSGYITDVKVVFDGDDRYRYLDKTEVQSDVQVFSGTGEGDDKIIATVKKCSCHGKVVLASNDNYVRNNARVYGASLIFSEELAKVRKKPHTKQKSTAKNISSKLQKEITREYKAKLGL